MQLNSKPFEVVEKTNCDNCGHKLVKNKKHVRIFSTTSGDLKRIAYYKVCPNCNTRTQDGIIGLEKYAKYSKEYKVKAQRCRYETYATLIKKKNIFDIFCSNATKAAPSTFWRWEQKIAALSKEKLQTQWFEYDGKIYFDAYYIKEGWRKKIEKMLGRKFLNREWNRFRNKKVLVASTNRLVVIDYIIVQDIDGDVVREFCKKIEERIGIPEEVTSDMESALMLTFEDIWPNAIHSYCVFHKIMKVNKIYYNYYRTQKDIPKAQAEFKKLLYKMLIESDPKKIRKMIRRANKKVVRLGKASKEAWSYVSKIIENIIKNLEMGFKPVTNNIMEQLFSFIDPFILVIKHFKTEKGLDNYLANYFHQWNHRPYETGIKKGFSPLQLAGVKVDKTDYIGLEA